MKKVISQKLKRGEYMLILNIPEWLGYLLGLSTAMLFISITVFIFLLSGAAIKNIIWK